MNKNENMFDRILRILMGIGLISMAIFGPKFSFGWIGVVPLLTGALGTCPVYSLLGISTCPNDKS